MREEIACVGRDRSLHGVVTLPLPAAGAGEWGVLLLNAGLLHRVGPHGWYVQVARALAAQGVTALRFDLSGVGDSGGRRGPDRFDRASIGDVRDAMTWMAERHGCGRFALLGMCIGAEIAFKVACVDPRVGGVVLVNSPRYHDEPTREFVAWARRRRRDRRRLRAALTSPVGWLREVVGRADAKALAARVGRRLRGALRAGAAGPPVGDRAHLRALLDRDVRVLFLLSEADSTFDYARGVFGRAVDRWRADGIASNPRVEVLGDGADHTLMPLASQRAALAAVTSWAGSLAR